MIDWSLLTPKEFELFCEEVLHLIGLKNVEWTGKGADEGVDLTGHFVVEFQKIYKQRNELWVVQCKKHKNRVSMSENLRRTLDFASKHNAQCLVFITTNYFTQGVKKWFKSIQKEYKIWVLYLEEPDLRRLIFENHEKLYLFLQGDYHIFLKSENPYKELHQEILGRIVETVLERGSIHPSIGGVKIANSFLDLEKILDWKSLIFEFNSKQTLKEVVKPLFEKNYLRFHGNSIMLTVEGFIIGRYSHYEKRKNLEMK